MMRETTQVAQLSQRDRATP